jgi:hypothetical protein
MLVSWKFPDLGEISPVFGLWRASRGGNDGREPAAAAPGGTTGRRGLPRRGRRHGSGHSLPARTCKPRITKTFFFA